MARTAGGFQNHAKEFRIHSQGFLRFLSSSMTWSSSWCANIYYRRLSIGCKKLITEIQNYLYPLIAFYLHGIRTDPFSDREAGLHPAPSLGSCVDNSHCHLHQCFSLQMWKKHTVISSILRLCKPPWIPKPIDVPHIFMNWHSICILHAYILPCILNHL